MNNLISKSAQLATQIAKELIHCEVGSRIPTTPFLSEKFNAGFGTIEKVFTSIKSQGAIKLQARGQMGTYLLSKDIIKLWEIADYGVIVGLLPLPNAVEYEGLATGFTESLLHSGIKFSLNFKHGGMERINSLLDNRCDFIVLSNGAAERALQEYKELYVIETLSQYTYYSGVYIIKRKDLSAEKKDWKIGIDKTSYDHIDYSENEFPDNPKVNVHYVNIPHSIVNGTIDAAIILNRTHIAIDMTEHLTIEPLAKNDFLRDRSSVAIVTKKQNDAINILFKEIANAKVIEDVQREVIERKIVPSF